MEIVACIAALLAKTMVSVTHALALDR